MQDALLRLADYWSSRGCLLAQPMNTKVGAGTLNPATFLRVLGPEPWSVAYVEPSVRPDDSRYGDNPNRLQTHTQYQVILKPEPGDPQELYLGSLEALGVDLRRHDVRFVEDDWMFPALGAWGLGWEVWLDGLEITQFTYFQQAGGFSLDPVSVEITYGMERIVMALQGVTHVKDIAYAPGVTWNEAFGQAEYEMSRYYLDDADVEANRRLFDEYEAEAKRLIAERLPVPAHEYVLMCSHAFNVLDARGAIGTTERARAFARMRRLAHDVAALWAQRRKELGHPLGDASTASATPATRPEFVEPADAAPAVLEIGVEELPPAEVTRTVEAVRAALEAQLDRSRLGHGAVRVVGAPRRIVAIIDAVQPREEDFEEIVRGPRASAAFDADGQPTKAGLGFARSKDVAVEELERLTIDDAEFVGLVRQVRGRPATEALAGVFAAVVGGLRGEKNMRWSAPGLTFSRPVRWLLGLIGQHVVPFAVAGLESGRTTRVHRTADAPAIDVASAERYLETLEAHGIVADGERRRAVIASAAVELAASVDGEVDLEAERAVLDEVVNLVEQPTPLLGSFHRRYLALPSEVLTTVMKKHQRYLPVRSAAGGLLPHFVAVANGEPDRDLVRAGNEAVLRARYEDATFFWEQDIETPLQDFKRRLAMLTFEERLGTMADRAERITAIAVDLAARVALADAERATLKRAGELAKFDLATQMVIELSSLAGTMAREYALRAGETPEVATALLEMELPRFAGDELPGSAVGALLALADRLDVLVGLFAIGSVPTGGSDPFALRRAALGVTGILRTQPRLAGLNVPDGLAVAAGHQRVEVTAEASSEAARFVARRLEQYLLAQGLPVAIVRAALAQADVPARAAQTAGQLQQLRETEAFEQLLAAIQRVRRIVPPDARAEYDPAAFEEAAERGLHDALQRLDLNGGDDDLTIARYAETAGALVEPINAFFEDVLVMADDPIVRANRLGLLAAVRDTGAGLIAWDELD